MTGCKTGVVFGESDYAGFITRFLIMTIDVTIITLLFIAGYLIDLYLYNNYITDSFFNTLYLALLFSYLYLTVIKASSLGTLGQRITKTKILHITGNRPNIFHMTYRLLFWLLGPANLVFDFAWMTLNKEKRTLRDSLCNTITVNKGALPISKDSRIRNIRVMVFGFHFLYDTANP